MRTSYILTLILALMLIISAHGTASAATITGYEAVFLPYRVADSQVRFAIRSFKRDGRTAYLVLDPYAFETSVVDGPLDFEKPPVKKDWEATPFIKALYRYTAPHDGIANQGVISAEGFRDGVFVTADMCPSGRSFEKAFFERTADLGSAGKPAPIAVMITGLWIERHDKEFRWLIAQQKKGRLDITWVNHSYTHPYKEDLLLDKNFLLMQGVEFETEVLSTEVLLLQNGLIPSPFFRYPGLISNADLQKRLAALTLIPIGANAWLAKGEAPVPGSIVLVHGNGNEPVGIKAVLTFFDDKKAEIKSGSLKLMGLKDAFGKGR
ncbi:MAG: polysaccharide deacetylase [Deltaproteobacteria bacterium]|nr:polysaccharide deacetylase [Deltaproteobacteria bacterium]